MSALSASVLKKFIKKNTFIILADTILKKKKNVIKNKLKLT